MQCSHPGISTVINDPSYLRASRTWRIIAACFGDLGVIIASKGLGWLIRHEFRGTLVADTYKRSAPNELQILDVRFNRGPIRSDGLLQLECHQYVRNKDEDLKNQLQRSEGVYISACPHVRHSLPYSDQDTHWAMSFIR